MTNWGFMADGQHGSIFPTTDPVDDNEIFATFTEARRALSDWFLYVADAYRDAARDARKLRKADVEARAADYGIDEFGARAVF
jgi:hypothetical protein